MKHRKNSAHREADKTLGENTPAALLEQLALHQVQVPGRKEVLSYLKRYPRLGDIISDICTRTRKDFGPQAELSLELYRDPEIDDRYLTLYVRQEEYTPGIMDRIEGVSRLFDKRLEKTPGSFLLTTDFCRPRGKDGV